MEALLEQYDKNKLHCETHFSENVRQIKANVRHLQTKFRQPRGFIFTTFLKWRVHPPLHFSNTPNPINPVAALYKSNKVWGGWLAAGPALPYTHTHQHHTALLTHLVLHVIWLLKREQFMKDVLGKVQDWSKQEKYYRELQLLYT